MSPRDIVVWSLMLALIGCGGRQASDGTDSGPDGGGDHSLLGEIDWSACVTNGEFETCAEVCVAQGLTCVAEGCPAEPMYCKPAACDMATSLLSLGDAICTNPELGAFVAAGCDEPIEFIFNDTARCCCEG